MASHVASADDADAIALRNKAVTEFASVIATLDGVELDKSEGDAHELVAVQRRELLPFTDRPDEAADLAHRR